MSDRLRILRETRIDIDEVCRRLGTDEKPVHFTTGFRATTRGILIDDGTRVYLESLKVGGRLISSIEAVERFIARINDIDLDSVDDTESTAPVSKRRARELAEVDRQLVAAGI